MIGCDKCEEWYHGTCVKITESGSKSIAKYFCPPCREINPKLRIKYKKQTQENISNNTNNNSHKPSLGPVTAIKRGIHLIKCLEGGKDNYWAV
ncbi:PHD finger and CXXC domaincontaining protein CG17446like [Caligus rogercresseyi]|uniref:PHD finger and CXXC domaincontaining protein CG17446like n=1 Tax=Caligus rogercresseyi TaxID=217165 RepID=A0A7T8K1X6_CALRO|nr:PHD finger and CXXC domaincontaining protein CG17446like [Caligus rogercresseyi]